HPDSAAVVEADPRRAGSRVECEIEQRPIGYGIGAVEHLFSFAIGARDRAGVEVVATDRDGRGDLSLLDEVVHGFAHPCAFTVAEPADARGKSLEGEAATGQT